ADGRIVGTAGLLVVNGLGFEGWMDGLVRAPAAQAPIIMASAGVAPRQAAKPGSFETATAGVDPHAWQSPHNAEIYVANIRDGLIRVDPPGRRTYEANAVAYIAELARLDTDIRRAVSAIPAARRTIDTSHPA